MKHRATLFVFFCAATLLLASARPSISQTKPAAPAAVPAPSEKDVVDVQEQMLKLLRLSPVLTTVVARDPSLLSDQQYVAHNNPELAQFIASHPDIARNPEFYLFSRLNPSDGKREKALERAVWPELMPAPYQRSTAADVVDKLTPIVIVPAVFLAIVWMFRIFLDGRRWSRTLKMQSEVHGRLIDKFSSNQELAAYMQTEAGQRFLSISPSSVGADPGIRMPNTVARVLTSLSAGIVLALLGIGFLLLRNVGPDTAEGMLIMGTLLLMPGIGFILSAGATWVVARRLGLLPEQENTTGAHTGSN